MTSVYFASPVTLSSRWFQSTIAAEAQVSC